MCKWDYHKLQFARHVDGECQCSEAEVLNTDVVPLHGHALPHDTHELMARAQSLIARAVPNGMDIGLSSISPPTLLVSWDA